MPIITRTKSPLLSRRQRRQRGLVTIISGHGQTDGDMCAEWCNHEHYFTVNGSAERHEVTHTDIQNPLGRAARADEAWYRANGAIGLRAGLLVSGLPVETVRFDITSQVTLGSRILLPTKRPSTVGSSRWRHR